MKPRIKSISISVAVDKNTDPFKIAEIVEQLIKQLEERNISRPITVKGVTLDPEGYE